MQPFSPEEERALLEKALRLLEEGKAGRIFLRLSGGLMIEVPREEAIEVVRSELRKLRRTQGSE